MGGTKYGGRNRITIKFCIEWFIGLGSPSFFNKGIYNSMKCFYGFGQFIQPPTTDGVVNSRDRECQPGFVDVVINKIPVESNRVLFL